MGTLHGGYPGPPQPLGDHSLLCIWADCHFAYAQVYVGVHFPGDVVGWRPCWASVIGAILAWALPEAAPGCATDDST